MRSIVNLLSCHISLLLNKVVLLGQAIGLLLSDLLLSELSLVVAFFTHTIEIMLHLLLLSAHFLDSCHLLIPEIFVSEVELLLFSFPAPTSSFAIGFIFSLACLLLTTALHNLVVVLVLKVLKLSCLFASLLYLLDSPDLFVLEHAHTIAKLLNVSLKLKAD